MTTYYVSKQSGASDSNNGTSTATPFLTIAHLLAVMVSRDTGLLRAGDTWTENVNLPSGLSGTSAGNTIFGAFNTNLGNGKAKIVSPNPGSTPLMQFNASGMQYIEFDDIEFTENASLSTGSFTINNGCVSTPSGGVSHITWRRCYFHDFGNYIFQSNNGPTPASSAASGTGSGNDTAWLWEDCEFYRSGNSCLIWHGTAAIWRRCHFHVWGLSNYTPGKHGIYNHSRGSVIDTCYFHNDECPSGSSSGPGQGSPNSPRVTGITVKDSIFHDCNSPANIFWYDNVMGVQLFLRNRMWNLYGPPFYFDSVNDTGPAYNWGPNPVDKIIFANNVMHMNQAPTSAIDLTSAAAAYLGGMVIANNVIVGNYGTYAINTGAHGFAVNPANSFQGKLLEKNNLWYSSAAGGAGTFYWNGAGVTLAGWQGAGLIAGNNQGSGSFTNSNPNLGSAPGGSSLRAPTPYQIAGVIQTPGDNALIGSTFGAPDYYPQTGSPVIDAGSTSVDPSVAYVFGG